MKDEESPASSTPGPPAIVPLPVGLYESNGVIFELYRGGQPYQERVIRWERLKTFIVGRDGGLTFNVRVSQAHQDNAPE